MKSVYAIPLLISLLFIQLCNITTQKVFANNIACREYVDKFTKYDKFLSNLSEGDVELIRLTNPQIVDAIKSVSEWYKKPLDITPDIDGFKAVYTNIDNLIISINSTDLDSSEKRKLIASKSSIEGFLLEAKNIKYSDGNAIGTGTISWEGQVIHAFASYMLERGEAELSAYFLDGLSKKVKKYKKFEDLFPDTYSLFDKKEIYPRYILHQAQPAFRSDLERLPRQLKYFDTSNLSENKAKDKIEVINICKDGISIGYEIYNNKENPLIVLSQVPNYAQSKMLLKTSLFLNDWIDTSGRSTKLHKIFNKSQNNIERNGKWLKHYISLALIAYLETDFNSLVKNHDTLFTRKKTIKNDLYQEIYLELVNAINGLSHINELFVEYSKLPANSTDNDVMDQRGLLQEKILVQSIEVLTGQIQAYLLSTKNKDFGKYKIIFSNIGELVDASIQVNYRRLASSASNIIFQLELFGKDDWTGKMIGFMGAIASSESEEEIKSAIQAFALPVGSWRAKANNEVSWSIDSYLGVSTGQAKTKLNNKAAFHSPKFNYGVFAPIGITRTWPKNISLMIYPIDLGRVVKYRFEEESISEEASDTTGTINYVINDTPDVKFGNVFELGIVFWWRPFHSPFTVGLGTSIGSLPWDANSEIGTKNGLSYQTWRVSVAIDMPLMILKSKI